MCSKPTFSEAAEFVSTISARPQVSHVVFDFDGTLSWLRHGWPQIMYGVFRPFFSPLPDETESTLRSWLVQDILSLNGQASIHQMIRCADRVRERGGAVLDPEALLNEYERRLDLVVRERTERIRGGQAKPAEFVVHGARELLEKLRQRNLVLIILSGTLEQRVKAEVDLLDLAGYFGAHVYGSTTDLAGSSKRAVIERLLRDEEIPGEQLLAFGDGPVEIQLAREAGGLAVGVASDEEQNGSGRIDEQKRGLLLRAGAQLLIADYRDGEALIECLLGK